MAIVGIGIDLVKISRLEKITARWEGHFLDRVFTSAEQAYCLEKRFPPIHFSGRFAIKEATLKALGSGLRKGMRWTDIETLNGPCGRPLVRVFGRVLQVAEDLGVSKILGSISHDQDYAVGQVVLQSPCGSLPNPREVS